MHTILTVGLVLSLAATEAPERPAGAEMERSIDAAVVERPMSSEVAPILSQIELSQVVEQDVAAQAQPPRGSFWWFVAAIVVAGVILAVIL